METGRHLAGERALGQVGDDNRLDSGKCELLMRVAEIAQI